MGVRRWAYRVRQFFEAVFSAPAPADLEQVRQILTPEQTALFIQMQPSEQAHAIRVLHAVQAFCHQQGLAPDEDLQTAALLHDVGKACYPLRLWERVIIVLGKVILPEKAQQWGMANDSSIPPRGWVRPFVVAAQHPGWGAELAAQHGASPCTVALIRWHQADAGSAVAVDRSLLAILQAVDDES